MLGHEGVTENEFAEFPVAEVALSAVRGRAVRDVAGRVSLAFFKHHYKEIRSGMGGADGLEKWTFTDLPPTETESKPKAKPGLQRIGESFLPAC